MKKIVLFFLIFIINTTIVKAETFYPIIINQVMIGQDEGVKNEFIELYNPNKVPINLKNYSLKKKTGSGNESSLINSKNFIGTIAPESYFLISSSDFGSIIKADLVYSNNNSLASDNTIILYNSEKRISDEISFTSNNTLKNNEALKRLDLKTPIKFDFVIEKEIIKIHNSKNDLITLKNYSDTTSNDDNKKQNDYKIVDLKNVKKEKNGTIVEVEGIVSVVPGILGSQYFFIHNKYDKDFEIYGLKIYNYNKLFPDIKINDKVKIKGELSIISNEIKSYKIKTKEINDIEIISSNNILASSSSEKINTFTFNQTDNLKTIEGQITQNSNKKIYLDDGQNEILIDLKDNIGLSKKELEIGKKFSITGLLAFTSSSSDSIKIIPLKKEDVKCLDNSEEITIADEKNLNDDFWETKKKNRNKTLLIYLIIIIISIFIFIIFRKK
jgi:hypothetical protein